MFSAGRLETGHPEEEVLERYVMGKLDEPTAELLEDHVFGCYSCQQRVEFTETYIRSMKSALAGTRTVAAAGLWRSRLADFIRMPAPSWVAAAAAALLVVGALVGTQYFSHTGMPVAVALTATRGETTSVVANGPLNLDLDARDMNVAARYRVQVVTAEGAGVWSQASAGVENGHLHVYVDKRLPPGQYFVRVFASNDITPREYALQLRRP